MRVLVILMALIWGSVATADVPARLEAAFRQWVAATGATRAVITVWRKGAHQRDAAVGMKADAPVPLASLSKVITALCAVQLVQSGRWGFETSSDEVLGPARHSASVAALMTHASGFGPDQTQGTMPQWLDDPVDRSEDAARTALERRRQTGEAGQFQYNNENYAVLGAMISAEVGVSHRDYCAQHVFGPAGVRNASPAERTGALAAWGGWQMPVQDYARLMYWGFGPQGVIGRDPSIWPSAAMGGGVSYGVGMTQRAFRGRMNYWHFGLLCFPGELNFGAYAVLWEGDWQVVVAYDRCTTWDEMVALDNALTRAVYP